MEIRAEVHSLHMTFVVPHPHSIHSPLLVPIMPTVTLYTPARSSAAARLVNTPFPKLAYGRGESTNPSTNLLPRCILGSPLRAAPNRACINFMRTFCRPPSFLV
jgi:hypothetical protein